MLEYGRLDPARDLEAFGRLESQAFMMPPPDRFDWAGEEGLAHLRVMRQGDAVVGGLSLLPAAQYFGGSRVPSAAVRAVAVAAEHRGAGVAGAMLQAMLAECRERGLALSVLYPATQPVYRKAGYEQAGVRLTYRTPLAGIALREPGALSPFEEADWPWAATVYGRLAPDRDGHLDRTSWFWRRPFIRRDEPIYAYAAPGAAGPDGYLVYVQRPGETSRYNLVVRDMAAATLQAGRQIWTFLAGHRSMADYVEWRGGPHDPALLWLAEQDTVIHQRQIWMLRLVDVPKALAMRGYAAGLQGEVHLAVSDEAAPWNAGHWVLSLDGHGNAEAAPGGRGDVQAHVRGLAAIYSGYLTPQQAAEAGLLSGAPADLERLRAFFAGPAPWMPDMF